MIKVVMKDAEDILIYGNDIERVEDEYHISIKTYNGILSSYRTIAIFKRKDVKMMYEVERDILDGN